MSTENPASLARYVATALRSLGYQASVTSVKGKTWEPYIARVAAPETKAQIGIANWIPDFADNNAIFPVQLTCGLPRRRSNRPSRSQPPLEQSRPPHHQSGTLDPVGRLADQ